jgi:hypothetical protein
MRTAVTCWGLALALLFLALSPANGTQQPQPTPEKVREAIRKGVNYLKSTQRDGNWEHMSSGLAMQYRGGTTALALWALLEADVDPEDDAIKQGLDYLRQVEPAKTYVVALQTMVFCKAAPKEFRAQIKRNVDWLVSKGKRQAGTISWSYPQSFSPADNSNTQYAVLALREAALVGVPPPGGDQVWKEIERYYVQDQLPNGGWSYRLREPLGERITMNTAGVCGLLIAGMQLNKNKERIRPDGSIENCGRFERNDPLARGMERMGETFRIRGGLNMRNGQMYFRFYNLYGIERAGRLSGQRFFFDPNDKEIDWYRLGAMELIDTQELAGCWRGHDTMDGNPILATSFSVLFLSKGKTPVLVFKMTHGDNRSLNGDWNNDRNDVRNLTEFCSHEIFKRNGRPVPLTWQIFDASRQSTASPQTLQDLLQAPVLFFNGHRKPVFTAGEKELLRKYLEQGGFIFAEACCSREEFDQGFRELIKEVCGEERPLTPLPKDHAIWKSAFDVPPGSFNLHGVDFGCKTCIVYSPEDLSCHWESNNFDANKRDADPRSVLAFRVGANVIAYATGLEPPEDKGTQKDIINTKLDPVRRGFLQAAQVNYGPDFQPARNAMRVLMSHMQKKQGLDVILQTKPILLGDINLPNYKFLYMHGRREFQFSEGHMKKLREHLENGGLLLADACCGDERFDKAFREMIVKTFGRPLEPIRMDDPFLSDKVGENLQRLELRTKRGAPYVSMEPILEGVRLTPDSKNANENDPKKPKSPWIVIYSKYDIGCALDRHSSSDCLGYSHESALKLAAQAVQYALKE